MIAAAVPTRTDARIGLLAGFWIFVGLFGGTSVWIGEQLGGGSVGWADAVFSALGAALIWIPITVAAAGLALRFPFRATHWVRPLLVHGTAALAVSFVLNFAYFAAWFPLSGQPVNLRAWIFAAGSAAFYFLHINALVYFAIVGVVHAYKVWEGGPAGTAGGVGGEGVVGSEASSPASYVARLSAGAAGRTTIIDVDDIRWIEADGDYARVHANGAEHLVSERMKHLETQLDPARFVRIHRSRIVNVDHLRDLRHIAHGDYEVTLDCDTVLRVSRSRRKELMAAVDTRSTIQAR